MSNGKSSAEAPQRSRLPDNPDGLIARLNVAEGKETRSADRAADRYPYVVKNLQVEFIAEAGGRTMKSCVGRNVSNHGMSVLVDRFYYVDTPCNVHMVTLHGSWEVVAGKVVRSQYLPGTGSVHEVGIRFESPIDLSRYVRRALKQRVLVADDSPTIHRLFAAYSESLGAEFVHARDGKEALAKALGGEFDVVLMDIEMPVMDGWETIRKLRESGYVNRVVIITADEQVTREAAHAAGFDDVLRKPFTSQQLRDCLDACRLEEVASTFADQAEMVEPLVDFVSALREMAKQLRAAQAIANHAEIRRIARLLAGEGAAFGFECLTESARTLLAELDAERPVDKSVSELVHLCMATRPPRLG